MLLVLRRRKGRPSPEHSLAEWYTSGLLAPQYVPSLRAQSLCANRLTPVHLLTLFQSICMLHAFSFLAAPHTHFPKRTRRETHLSSQHAYSQSRFQHKAPGSLCSLLHCCILFAHAAGSASACFSPPQGLPPLAPTHSLSDCLLRCCRDRQRLPVLQQTWLQQWHSYVWCYTRRCKGRHR